LKEKGSRRQKGGYGEARAYGEKEDKRASAGFLRILGGGGGCGAEREGREEETNPLELRGAQEKLEEML